MTMAVVLLDQETLVCHEPLLNFWHSSSTLPGLSWFTTYYVFFNLTTDCLRISLFVLRWTQGPKMKWLSGSFASRIPAPLHPDLGPFWGSHKGFMSRLEKLNAEERNLTAKPPWTRRNLKLTLETEAANWRNFAPNWIARIPSLPH